MDKAKDNLATAYLWMIPYLTRIARDLGYALGVHGSMNRDLDLIAVPWVDEAVPPEELIEALCKAVEGHIVATGTKGGRWDVTEQKFVEVIIENPSKKPHGRLAWNIHFASSNLYLDVSVMPRNK